MSNREVRLPMLSKGKTPRSSQWGAAPFTMPPSFSFGQHRVTDFHTFDPAVNISDLVQACFHFNAPLIRSTTRGRGHPPSDIHTHIAQTPYHELPQPYIYIYICLCRVRVSPSRASEPRASLARPHLVTVELVGRLRRRISGASLGVVGVP